MKQLCFKYTPNKELFERAIAASYRRTKRRLFIEQCRRAGWRGGAPLETTFDFCGIRAVEMSDYMAARRWKRSGGKLAPSSPFAEMRPWSGNSVSGLAYSDQMRKVFLVASALQLAQQAGIEIDNPRELLASGKVHARVRGNDNIVVMHLPYQGRVCEFWSINGHTLVKVAPGARELIYQ